MNTNTSDSGFSADFFSHVRARTRTPQNPFHDRLSTESPPKEQESNIAFCGGRVKGEQHRKKNLIYEGLAVFYIGVSVSW